MGENLEVLRDLTKVQQGFALVLEGLGVVETAHTKGTARRAARAWFVELCSGLGAEPPDLTTFVSEDNRELVVLRGIPVRSVCAHHLLPFIGEATVAYIPTGGRIIGLSKLSRLVDYHCRRPQVQEELTKQIADALWAVVCAAQPHGEAFKSIAYGNAKEGSGVGVTIRANHMCMAMRGVMHNGDMVTSALRGMLRDAPEARAEFLQYVPDRTGI